MADYILTKFITERKLQKNINPYKYHTYVYIYVCVCICVCVYIYIYIYIQVFVCIEKHNKGKKKFQLKQSTTVKQKSTDRKQKK